MALDDFAAVSPWFLLVAPLVVVAAYTVFGLSGFGSTMISVPLLAHFLPVAYLVPLMVLLDLGCAAFIGTTERRHVDRGEIKRIVPFMFGGFAVGAFLLVGVADTYLRAALGIFAAAVGIHGIANPVLTRAISPWWSVPAGIFGGVVATLFGAGGPVYATYLSGRMADKSALRSTVSTLILISAFSRAIVYAVAGLLLHAAIAVGVVVLAPFVWIGLKLGSRIHTGLTQAQLRRVIGVMLVCTGASLLARTFLWPSP